LTGIIDIRLRLLDCAFKDWHTTHGTVDGSDLVQLG